MNKKFLVSIMLVMMFASMAFLGTNSVSATAGTAGAFSANNPNESADDTLVTFYFESLTASADYILVCSLFTNKTFSVGASETSTSVSVRVSGSGSATVTLYGYASGVASGSALGTWEFSITATDDGSQISNLYPYFIGLAIVGIIIGAIYKRQTS